MATIKDVVELAESRGFVNISLLQGHFDLTVAQACRALQACWERGLLLPTMESFFAKPVDGRPTAFREGRESRGKWYEPQTTKIKELLESQEGVGVTVRDVERALDISNGQARAALKYMVEVGQLAVGEASTGGLYGKRPTIYGVDEVAISRRDDQIYEDREAKKSERAQARKEAELRRKARVAEGSTAPVKRKKAKLVRVELDNEW